MPRFCAGTTPARLVLLVIWLSLAAVFAASSSKLSANAQPDAKAEAGPLSPDPPQRLYVSHSLEGRWLAWIERDGQRVDVEIPQTRNEVSGFAEKHRYILIWHDEQQSRSRPPGGAEARNAGAPESSPARPAEPAEPTGARAVPGPGGTADAAAAPARSAAPPAGSKSSAPLTPAEQITRLQRTIEADQRRRDEFQAALDHPMGEYARAETAFREIEQKLEQQKAALQQVRDEQRDAEAVDAEARVAETQTKWKLARERFDLAIHARQVQQEKIVSLNEKLRQDRAALDRLTKPRAPEPGAGAESGPVEVPSQTAAAGGKPAETSAATTATGASAAPRSSAHPDEPRGQAAAGSVVDDPRSDAAIRSAAVPNPTEPTASAASPTAGPSTVGEAKPAAARTLPEGLPPSAELVEAKRVAESKDAAAREAEQEADTLSDRVRVLDRNVGLQQRLLDNARRRRDNANESRLQLENEYRESLRKGIPPAELRDLLDQIDEAEGRFLHAANEVREGAEQLDAMQSERAALQAEALAALTQAAASRRAADAADLRVQDIQNPFTVRNVLQWSLDHGPRLLLIVLGMFLLKLVMRAGTRRLVAVMARSGARGTREEREDRARTLVSVFHSAGSVAIIVGGTLMICDEVGIAVAPLMGGAAVLGLAVAFGAQNLIRDYFYGFVILLENQYKINDVVRIGDIAGQVERITLRVTVLRDLEGRVHFIPNGQIHSVTNMTHGWSRALFEIGVAYKEDADRVMDVLVELAHELRRDPNFGSLILDNAEMLGVDSFGDSSINIKFFIKTRPLKQWTVKRELLRRIKRRFDDLGIEIPFPHRTVYHRQNDEAGVRKLEADDLGREAA